jgi:hypothetical protein
MSPRDPPNLCEYSAAGIFRPVGQSVLYDHSGIIRVLNQKLDQSLERPIIANKINSGWVRPGAMLGPLLLNCRVSGFVAELREGRPRCGAKIRGSALVILGQAGELAKDGDGEIPSNGRLQENYIVSILGFHCLEIIMRCATG